VREAIRSVHRFLASEDGPTAVEYAFMLALIIIVCLAAVRAVGTSTSQVFSQAGAGLPGGS
jgi:pilus assembly protein Flp/PilA